MRGYPEGFQTYDAAGAAGDTYDIACPGGNTLAPSCQTFLTSQINDYVAEQIGRKNRAIENSVLQTKNVFDTHINAASTLIRNRDLLDTKGFVDAYNQQQLNSVQYDNDITRRQFEINEYHYHNKLDTLFFLQIFFIAVLIMAILVYFNRRGIITNQMMMILVAGLAIILIVVGVSRYFYTIRTRDRRLWHRRYFQTEKEPGPDFITTCPGPTHAPVINLNAIFSTDATKCTDASIKELKNWNSALEAEAVQQANNSILPASIFSGSTYSIPTSCKK